jgi:hypothetical protein
MLPRHMNDVDERFAAFSDSAVSFGGKALRDFVLHHHDLSGGPGAASRAPSVRQVWDDSGCFLDIAGLWILGSQTSVAQGESIAPFHNAAVDESLHDPAVIRAPQPSLPAGLERIFGAPVPTRARGARDKASALRRAQSLRSAASGGIGASGLLGRRLTEAVTLADPNDRNSELSSVAEQVYAEGGMLAGKFFSSGTRFEFETQTATELPIATAVPQWGLPSVSAIFTSRQHWVVDRLTGDHQVLPLFPEVRFNTVTGTAEQRAMAITLAATDLLSSFREMRPAVANAVARLTEHRHAVSESSSLRWNNRGNAPKWDKGQLQQRHMRDAFASRVPAPFPCGRDSTYAQPVWLRPRTSLGIASLAPAPMKCVPAAMPLRWRSTPAREQPGYATMLGKLGKTPLPYVSRWSGDDAGTTALPSASTTRAGEPVTKSGADGDSAAAAAKIGPQLHRRAAAGALVFHNTFRLDSSDDLTDSGGLTRTQAYLQTAIQGPRQRVFSDAVVAAGRLVGASGLTSARMRDVRSCTIDISAENGPAAAAAAAEDTNLDQSAGGAHPAHVLVKVWPATWSSRVPERFRTHKVLSRRRPAFLLLMLETDESRAALWKWLDQVSPTTRHRKLSWPVARGSIIILGAESGGDATAAFNFPWNAPVAEFAPPCFALRPEHDRVLTMSSQYKGSGLASASGHRVVVRRGVPFVTRELAELSVSLEDASASDDWMAGDAHAEDADEANDVDGNREFESGAGFGEDAAAAATDDEEEDEGLDAVPDEADGDADAVLSLGGDDAGVTADGNAEQGPRGAMADTVPAAGDDMVAMRLGQPVFSRGLLYGFVGPDGKLITWVESYRLPPRVVPPTRRSKQ